MKPYQNAITDVPGILVGHADNPEAITGCTVILCPAGAVGGVDQRGGAPGTRETDSLHPMRLVKEVHAVLLTGGSAFGLDAAGGVVRWLEERGIGFDVGVARVPIVPAAVLFDLAIGRADVRPDAEMGYIACMNASDSPPAEGSTGAGMGATVGKYFGMKQAMKSGIGSASLALGSGIFVGAIAAVNAFGDVIDPDRGRIIAGTRSLTADGKRIGREAYFANTLWLMKEMGSADRLRFGSPPEAGSTVIGVVATNAGLSKEQANKMAQMAQDGLARAIRPAHTMLDGDTIFALSTGTIPADVNVVGAYAAEVFARAVIRAVHAARPLADLPSAANNL